MNDTIYDFFKDNYGTTDSLNQPNGPFRKYNRLTIKQLNRELAQLKGQDTPHLLKLGTYLASFVPILVIILVLLNQMILPEATIISYTKIFGASSKIASRRISLSSLRSHRTTVQILS